MRAGRLRDTGRSFCCTRKYRKGRKRKKSERKSGNLLNTDLQNTIVRKIFFEYPPTLNLDDIVKDIFLKIPLGNETYIVNVTAGGSIKMIVQSYGIWEFASAIVFSYAFPGIIFYRKVSGIIFKNVADWTETMV